MAVGADEYAELGAELAEVRTQLAESDARIAELEEQLATALAAIERLTEEVNRNSTNSHLPPSSDGPGAVSRGVRRPKTKKSKRKRGGQKGRRGAHRELLSADRVDEVVDVFPAACEACARPLSRDPEVDARRYQQIDLLLAGPHVTEWRRHEVQCVCGHCTRASYDASQIPTSPFGPRLVSIVAALTGVYHLSRRRVQMLLHEFFGIDVSLGVISKMEARMSLALQSATGEAHDDVVAAMVKHADATSWLLAGVTMSLWTLSTKLTTVFRIFTDGRRSTIEQMFKNPFGRLFGILVSDRASVFGFWAMALRQVCWAHLLRKFVSFSQRDGPVGTFGRELLDYAALVFEYWRGFEEGKLSRDELKAWMAPVRKRFEATLERIVAAELDDCSGSCGDILAHKAALWTFVDIPGVDPTNNLAERDLRALVIWRKLCFGSQSERGLRFVERVMTVAHTLRKRGRAMLDFFERTVAAHVAGEPMPRLLPA